MSTVLYALAVVCGCMAACSVWQWHRADGRARRRAWGFASAACGIIAIAAAAVCGYLQPSRHGCVTGISVREGRYLEVQMEIVGAFVGQQYPGAKILLITDPETQFSKARLVVMRRDLEKGLGSGAQIVAAESPRPPEMSGGESQEMMMYEYYLTAAVFDKMIEDHPECDMVVSLMGLPYDFVNMRFWGGTEAERPKLVLLNADIQHLGKAIRTGFITAVVVHRPDVIYDINEVVPSDVQAAFDQRYLLITAGNVNAIAAKYPDMFDVLDKAGEPGLEPVRP